MYNTNTATEVLGTFFVTFHPYNLHVRLIVEPNTFSLKNACPGEEYGEEEC